MLVLATVGGRLVRPRLVVEVFHAVGGLLLVGLIGDAVETVQTVGNAPGIGLAGVLFLFRLDLLVRHLLTHASSSNNFND